ncbi:hypothetical protein D915_009276 [Fasciola hepatica]|uniref:Uncharacterized protein n=1 Tax=Fasciola hepatica TaxID=6192 RepID=A0A2H1BWG1_FASHE|nr:hypothetical protein D915_009276 [Fasciola hepatica]
MIPDAHTTVANQLVQFVSATKRFPGWQTKSQFEDSAHLPLLHSTHPDSHLPTSPWHTIYEILAHEFARHLTAKKIPASSRTGSFLCAYAGHLFCLEHGLVDPGPDVASLTSSSVSLTVPLAIPSLSSV